MRAHPVVLVPQDTTSLNELFTLARDPKSPRLLVRACQGRRRKVSTEAGRLPLWEHMQALPVAGHMSVDIPRRGRHKTRTALLSVRFGPVRIDPPQEEAGTAGTAEAPIDLWAVHLFEEDPPEGVEAMEWMLLTNVPTTGLEEALERARWYASRWGIEVVLPHHPAPCDAAHAARCDALDRHQGRLPGPQVRRATPAPK